MAQITILPNADITTEWDCTIGNHYTALAFDISAVPGTMDDEYIDTTVIDEVDAVEFENSPANLSECTAIEVSLRGQVDDVGAAALVEVAVTHTGGTVHIGASPFDVDGNDFATYGNLGTFVIPEITGLNLTKTQIDSLRVGMTFRAS